MHKRITYSSFYTQRNKNHKIILINYYFLISISYSSSVLKYSIPGLKLIKIRLKNKIYPSRRHFCLTMNLKFIENVWLLNRYDLIKNQIDIAYALILQVPNLKLQYSCLAFWKFGIILAIDLRFFATFFTLCIC